MKQVRVTRAQARLLQIERIKMTSRRLLAEKGAPALSLREVAREMDLVSSALYRYFATRDDLLTALIVDAYNDLGEVAERALRRSATNVARQQLHAVASAIRTWAKRNPNEYALLYGSPVPGYEAPEYTVAAAARVALVLGSIVVEAWHGAPSSRAEVAETSLGGVLETKALDESMPGVPEAVRVLALMMWSQIFGCISFELFGHYKGTVRSASRFFNIVVDEVANLVLPKQ
jgi:AcrR family transcriptional regulator